MITSMLCYDVNTAVFILIFNWNHNWSRTIKTESHITWNVSPQVLRARRRRVGPGVVSVHWGSPVTPHGAAVRLWSAASPILVTQASRALKRPTVTRVETVQKGWRVTEQQTAVSLSLYAANISHALMAPRVWIPVMGTNVAHAHKEWPEMGPSLDVVLLNVRTIFVFREWSVWILPRDSSVALVQTGTKETEVTAPILTRFAIHRCNHTQLIFYWYDFSLH